MLFNSFEFIFLLLPVVYAGHLLLSQPAGSRVFPLWDFGDHNQVTAEPVPPPGGRMRCYWDSSHYKPSVGRLVAERMFAYGKDEVPPGFGVALTPAMIEGQLAATRAAREQYRLERAEEIRALAAIQR